LLDTFGVNLPEAYERLLLDVIRGRPTLFMRVDEVEAAWRWTDSILQSWQQLSRAGPALYRRFLGAQRRHRVDRARRQELARRRCLKPLKQMSGVRWLDYADKTTWADAAADKIADQLTAGIGQRNVASMIVAAARRRSRSSSG
jgi:hypothetical protein